MYVYVHVVFCLPALFLPELGIFPQGLLVLKTHLCDRDKCGDIKAGLVNRLQNSFERTLSSPHPPPVRWELLTSEDSTPQLCSGSPSSLSLQLTGWELLTGGGRPRTDAVYKLLRTLWVPRFNPWQHVCWWCSGSFFLFWNLFFFSFSLSVSHINRPTPLTKLLTGVPITSREILVVLLERIVLVAVYCWYRRSLADSLRENCSCSVIEPLHTPQEINRRAVLLIRL